MNLPKNTIFSTAHRQGEALITFNRSAKIFRHGFFVMLRIIGFAPFYIGETHLVGDSSTLLLGLDLTRLNIAMRLAQLMALSKK